MPVWLGRERRVLTGRAQEVSLTGAPLLVVLVVLAIAGPVGLTLGWRRLPKGVVGAITRLVTVLLCQAVAISAIAVAVNRSFEFYDSWNDLLGRRQTGQIQVANDGQLVPADGSEGQVRILTVHGKVSDATEQVLIWLPPEYIREPKATFPVLMALPGQPGTPAGIFKTLDLAQNAIRTVAAGQVKPFVAVIPPLSIAAPRDTECTDIPRGPQADSWLATDVKEAVVRHFRVTPEHWSTIGWSTGGFCAAKMLLRHGTSFGAAVSIGGYFAAEEDHTTGSLFNHSNTLRKQNSPLWLLQHTLTYPVHLLIVTSKGDRESWDGVSYADAKLAVEAGTGVPGVNSIVLPTGGHNFSTYAPTIMPSFAWLGTNAGL
jgi:enterochelin esterase-like enzyme